MSYNLRYGTAGGNKLTQVTVPNRVPVTPTSSATNDGSRPATRPRTYFDDLNDPVIQQYKRTLDNWRVYAKWVQQFGEEIAFAKTVEQVGEVDARLVQKNYHDTINSWSETWSE